MSDSAKPTMTTTHDNTLEQARTNMIKQQLRTWDVFNEDVLGVFATTPRENFVPPIYRKLSYADMALPIGFEQIMWTPREEARCIQALQIHPADKILEIGTGTGYMTALLAKQSAHVFSIDIYPEFTLNAAKNLSAIDIHNVTLKTADASAGWPEAAPYDVILITGAMPILPVIFRENLALGGRTFAIIGQKPVMEAICFTRIDETRWEEKKIYETVVPSLIHALTPSPFKF